MLPTLKSFIIQLFPVRLGEGGINNGIIQPVAYKRGVDTLIQFAEKIREFKAERVSAIATSALRSASNGHDFIEEVKAKNRNRN